MHKNLKKSLSAIVVMGLFLVPTLTFAGTAANIFPDGYWGPLVSCGMSAVNACKSLCDLLQTGQNVSSFFMTILFFIGVPVFIMWGGFLILVSGGSPNKVTEGRSIITGAVIGALIALGAYLIIQTFLWVLGAQAKTVGEEGKIPWPEIQCNP